MVKVELSAERASVVSSVSASAAIVNKVDLENGNSYAGMKTPADEQEVEGGALRAGGRPDLYSKECIGLLAQYACVGLIYGTFPRTVYPFLNNYLNMDGYQTTAAQQLVSLPWSLKTFIGMTSDSFPIFGYRRRPYMLLGWGLCLVMLVIMAVLPISDPFFLNPDDRAGTKLGHIADMGNLTAMARFNFDAPGSGSGYILMMMFASFGYVVADVAADGMVVEFAQREPEEVRGETQTTIYMIRFIFQIIAAAMIGFCLNGKEYGGDFNWSFSFNTIMIILCVPCALVLPITWFFLGESKHAREPFLLRLKEMWGILQQRAIWQIMAYKFFSGICSNWSNTASAIVQRDWAHVRPLNDSIAYVIAISVLAFTLYIVKGWGLQWSWRLTMIWTTLFALSVDIVVTFITVYDVFRNEWFFLGVPLVNEFPEGIRFIVSTFVVVEVAEAGHEGLTYGLLTTISNLSGPFSSSIYKNILAYFDIFAPDIKEDSPEVRNRVAYAYLLMYGMNLVALLWLPLLPNQKKEAQALKKRGGSNFYAGVVAVICAAFALTWSIMTNMMSIFPTTACLRIAGGGGC